jgi:CRP-like cAMP-binding protein
VSEVDPEVLKRTTVFSTATVEQLAKLAEMAELTSHPPGEALLEEGTVGHRFHLLLDGGASVERDGREVGTVHAGEFVGEISLLGGGRVTATVRSTSPTRCLTIGREPFWRLLEAEPALALRILEVVCRRLTQEARLGATANL